MAGEGIVDQRKTHLVEDTISSGAQVSGGVSLQGRPILGVLIPPVNGTTPEINAEVSIDAGSNWYDLLEDDGSTEAIAITAMATAFFVSSDDLSPLAAYCGGAHSEALVRLVIDTEQTADREVTWVVCA